MISDVASYFILKRVQVFDESGSPYKVSAIIGPQDGGDPTPSDESLQSSEKSGGGK